MSVYEYIGKKPEDADKYALFIRRQSLTAYTETDNGKTLLITDYIMSNPNYTYLGKRK